MALLQRVISVWSRGGGVRCGNISRDHVVKIIISVLHDQQYDCRTFDPRTFAPYENLHVRTFAPPPPPPPNILWGGHMPPDKCQG